MNDDLNMNAPLHQPKVVVLEDSDQVGARAAEIIASTIRDNPHSILGLATGGSPIRTYRELVRMHRESELDFSAATSFNLDEYVGLDGGHPQSFRHFMDDNLFSKINIDLQKTHVPDGLATDVQTHCRQYEDEIRRSGGIELQLLGIGHNGHIAFNEPGSELDSRTREVSLTAETIEKNSRFFDSVDDVPRTAVTMGIGTILEAKRLLLIAYGSDKAEAIDKMIRQKPSLQCPASLLQYHPEVTVLVDKAAFGG